MQGDGGEDDDEDEDEDHHHHPQERVSKSLGTSAVFAAAPGLDSHHVARFFLNPRQKKN
jgi:hypothetical protein